MLKRKKLAAFHFSKGNHPLFKNPSQPRVNLQTESKDLKLEIFSTAFYSSYDNWPSYEITCIVSI